MPGKAPPIRKRTYNQAQQGVYGEFGSGADTKIMFIQTTIRPADLKKTTLISDIPGSEAWPVPDLFQREVDLKRVSKSLLPYLQDKKRVKFFNPLTLTLLPFDSDSRQVLTTLPDIAESEEKEGDTKYTIVEMAGFYRYRHMADPPWGELEWNDTTVKLVAIDGQHRLSALKRFASDPQGDTEFQTWAIPVVILAFRGTGPNRIRPKILEVVRSIFTNINKEARAPNEARRILLSDDSINAVATQELLQLSHANDVLDAKKRVKQRVPLLFYDWRGEEDDGRRVMSPAALKMIEEINHWFHHYVCGPDFSTKQETALSVQPVDPLKRAFIDKRLDAETSGLVREMVRADLVPSVAHLIENFAPYRTYIGSLRDLESKQMAKSDISRHAFHQLRFGSHQGGEAIHKPVMDMFDEIVNEIDAIKRQEIKAPLDLDIGMRGVLSAFGELRSKYSAAKKKESDWKEYVVWFTDLLNDLYVAGHIDTSRANLKALVKHIIQDHNDNVVNYRLPDAQDAFGAFVALLVCAAGSRKKGLLDKSTWESSREEFTERLEATIMRGYKKEVRPILREDHPKGGKELTEAVNKEAEKRTRKHLQKLDELIERVVAKSGR